MKIAIILVITAFAAAQNEELYTKLSYMALHQIGNDDEYECGRDELLNYLQQAFKIDNETHQQALEKAKNMKALVTHLNVGVINGKDLDWKDSDGNSDPFCTLYTELSSSRYNTTVKQKTLAPVWNEYFDLLLEDAENDVLHLDVWDVDPLETFSEALMKFNNVKGVMGVIKLVQEVAASGTTGNPEKEFIGGCKIAVKDIPIIGERRWCVLKDDETSDVSHGALCVTLRFRVKKNTRAAVQEHRLVLRTLLLHELETGNKAEYRWWGTWSAAAGILINQHRARNGLLPRNVALSEWVEYASRHESHPLDFYVFKKLAKTLIQPIVDGLFSSDDVLLFWDAARKVLYSCFRNIKEMDSPRNRVKNFGPRLEYCSGIISSVSRLNIPEDIDLFPIQMYDWLPEGFGEEIDVVDVLEFTVRETGIAWWNDLLENNTPETGSRQDAIEYRIKIIRRVMAELKRVSYHHHKQFMKKVNFPYSHVLYSTFEEKLTDLCMTTVIEVCQKLQPFDVNTDDTERTLGSKLFELYRALKEFVTYGESLGIFGQWSMNIQSYYKWIRNGVHFRLEMEISEALVKIEDAIKIDNLDSAVPSCSSITSSAVDTVSMFEGLISFWKQIAWPDVEESLMYIGVIINDICGCSVNYTHAMSAKFDDIRQALNREDDNATDIPERASRVSAAGNFAANNINHVKSSIKQWATDFPLQELMDALDNNENQRDVAETLRGLLQNVIDETVDILEMETTKLRAAVSDLTTPIIIENLMDGPEWNASESGCAPMKRSASTTSDEDFLIVLSN